MRLGVALFLLSSATALCLQIPRIAGLRQSYCCLNRQNEAHIAFVGSKNQDYRSNGSEYSPYTTSAGSRTSVVFSRGSGGYSNPVCQSHDAFASSRYADGAADAGYSGRGVPYRQVGCSADFQTQRTFALGSFFGSVNSVFTDAEYEHRLELNWKYDTITDETDDSGLPLAPENEDYDIDDTVPESDTDLTKPPSSKEDWYLKRMARGRRFWHKYFADPSQQSLRFYRLVKMKHDLKFCNRVVRRKYIELRPEIKPEVVDGRVQPLTRRQRNQNRSRIQVVRTTVGYDNSSDDSNVLILLTLPQARLVRMVERIRLPHLLALRNYEMLRMLRHSMLFMSKPNIFESTVDFLLTFSRFNHEFDGDIPLFCELPSKPVKRFRPMIYAVIGKLRQDPFADHLLKVRRSQPPPIREPFPRCESNESSTLTKFLDSCATLIMERLRNAEYDFDAVMDRDFSDNFAEMMPTYTTKESVNRIDYPVTVSFSKEMAPYLREPVTPPPDGGSAATTDGGSQPANESEAQEVVEDGDSSEDGASADGEADGSDAIGEASTAVPPRGSTAPWTRDEVKLMLKRVMKLGLTKPSTIIDRMRRLHCDIGFSFEDLLWLGRTRPQLFRYGNYKQRCQQIYDCDESLTFEDILSMVHRYPNLLTFNIGRTVRPKIYYFRRVMRRDVAELTQFPKFLSFSLYDRIIPRHLAVMNAAYRGEFLKVYRFLFESGFYKGYGQTVTDERVPDILPADHGRYMAAYEQLSRAPDLRLMFTSSDDAFLRHFNLSYRDLAQGKEDAMKIPLPADFPVDADIREPRVRVLRDGKFVGDFDLAEAQSVAREAGLNLILFRPRSSPPICVLAKYTEFIEQQRSLRERSANPAKNTTSAPAADAFSFDPSLKVKVVQISSQCADNDFARKVQSARKFLESGHRVELVVFAKSARKGRSATPMTSATDGHNSAVAAAVASAAAKGVPLSYSLDNPLIQRVDYIYAQLADVGRPFTLRSKVDTKQRQLLLKFWPV
ncbi:translation initiation factor if-3 [Babesia ovata]|uniref:Translation initiation factor if-3 n=1 Tax=Babesia ovata TaxID=189622 RepID=A0A2H6KBU6_9APIC|nr:translation initiation factor if-3 [Babesia ovata]GBE60468.1 translation initiation factor if-3 [Babesia ovata]